MRVHGRIDPASGVYTPYAQSAPSKLRRPVDPDTAREEAQHLGAALAEGVRVLEARADNPTADMGGRVRFVSGDPRTCARIAIAGALNTASWPPAWPSKSADTGDERDLAGYVEQLGLDKAGYDELCDEARRMMEDSRVADVMGVAETLMAHGVVLDEARIAMIRDALEPRSLTAKGAEGVRHKSFGLAKASTSGPTGEFQALVSVFGNVDKGGDRILKGAFDKTLRRWRASGDPIPVIHSHLWTDPNAHIGIADPNDVVETDRGLLVRGQLDVNENPSPARSTGSCPAGR